MAEQECSESDSSGSEFRARVPMSRSKGLKEARLWSSSRSSVNRQDPMPDYVDPELLKLIAKNAPFELDLFSDSLHVRTNLTIGDRDRRIPKVNEWKPGAISSAPLVSVREQNENSLSNRVSKGVWHSCPERTWSDMDEKDDGTCRGAARSVKRKRRKSLDMFGTPNMERRPQSKDGSRRSRSDNFDSRAMREASCLEETNGHATSSVIDHGYTRMEDNECPPLPTAKGSSAPSLLATDVACDTTNAKPWRQGMKKRVLRTAKDDKLPESFRCKRKAQAGSRTTAEVRKFMEIKELERRKEQQQLKAEANAALAAREEQRRKLNSHLQAMFQTQKAGRKSGKLPMRPVWVSECSNLGEPPRPWSSSSGDINYDLPPPVTPPNLEPAPLDLYTTRFQYTERQDPINGVDEDEERNSRSVEILRFKQAKGCTGGVEQNPKYRKGKETTAICHTDFDPVAMATAKVRRRARGKARPKPRARRCNSEKAPKLRQRDNIDSRSGRSRDLEVYRRSLGSGNLFGHAKASSRRRDPTKSLPTGHVKSILQSESFPKTLSNDSAGLLATAKRLNPTQPIITYGENELTAKGIETLRSANIVSSDWNQEIFLRGDNDVAITERITKRKRRSSRTEIVNDIQRSGRHSLGTPIDHNMLQKRAESVLGSQTVSTDDEDARQKSRYHPLECAPQPFKPREVRKHIMEVPKEELDDRYEMRSDNNITGAGTARYQAMHLLKNLAEKLVNQVNSACAIKGNLEHTIIEKEHTNMHCVNSEMDIKPQQFSGLSDEANRVDKVQSPVSVPDFIDQSLSCDIEPSVDLAGAPWERKFSDSGLNIVYQPKRCDMHHFYELSEQEQAGCEVISCQGDGSKSSSKAHKTSTSVATDCKYTESPDSETPMSWTTSGVGTDVNSKSSSVLPSFTPDICSRSPVILPTSTKYHMERIKNSKLAHRVCEIRHSEKDEETSVVERDKHGILDLYSQQVKKARDVEKGSNSHAHVLQDDLNNSNVQGIETGSRCSPWCGVQKNTPTYARPTLKCPEYWSTPVEPKGVQTIQSGDSYHSHKECFESDVRVPDLRRKENISLRTCENLQEVKWDYGNQCLTSAAEHNKPKMVPVPTAGLEDPGLFFEEMKDLKACQSRTPSHVRKDISEGDELRIGKGEDQKPVEIGALRAGSNSLVTQRCTTREQWLTNFIPPMKITYMRRTNSRSAPESGCTDDESVVVEFHQINMGQSNKNEGDNTIGGRQVEETREDFGMKMTSLQPATAAEKALPSYVKKWSTEGTTTIGNESKVACDKKMESEVGVIGALRSPNGPAVEASGESLFGAAGNGTAVRSFEGKPRFSSLADDGGKCLPPSRIGGITSTLDQLKKVEVRNSNHSEAVYSTAKFDLTRRRCDQSLTVNPISDNKSDMVIYEQRTGTQDPVSSAQKIDLGFQLDNIPELHPETDIQDDEELELKLKRKQLEEELQKIDIQIMSSRAKLKQSHFGFAKHVKLATSASSADQAPGNTTHPCEIFKPLEKLPSSTRIDSTEGHGDLYQMTTDSQMPKLCVSPLNSKVGGEERKRITSCKFYADHIANEDTNMSEGELKADNGEFLSNRNHYQNYGRRWGLGTDEGYPVSPQQSESPFFGAQPGTKLGHTWSRSSSEQSSDFIMPTIGDAFAAATVLEEGNGRESPPGAAALLQSGSGQKVAVQDQAMDGRCAAARPDQRVDEDVGMVIMRCPPDNVKVIDGPSACTPCGHPAGVEDSATRIENNERGPWTATLDKVSNKIKDKPAIGTSGQTSSMQDEIMLEAKSEIENISHEAIKSEDRSGAQERSDSIWKEDVFQSRFEVDRKDYGFMPWRKLDKNDVEGERDLTADSGVFPCPEQDRIVPANLERGQILVTCDIASRTLPSSVDERTEIELSCANASSNPHLSAVITDPNSNGRVHRRGFDQVRHKTEEDSIYKVATPECFQSLTTLNPVEFVARDPLPLNIEETQNCGGIVQDALQYGHGTSQDALDNVGRSYLQNPALCEAVKHFSDIEPTEGAKFLKWLQDDKVRDGASTDIHERVNQTVLKTDVLPCGFTNGKADRSSASLISGMKSFTVTNDSTKDELPLNDLSSWSNRDSSQFTSLTSAQGVCMGKGLVTDIGNSMAMSTLSELENKQNQTQEPPTIMREKSLPLYGRESSQEDSCLQSSLSTIGGVVNVAWTSGTSKEFCSPKKSTIVVSSKEPPSFLTSQYFNRRTADCSNSEGSAESVISEDLEDYDSDIAEDLQQDDVDIQPSSVQEVSKSSRSPQSEELPKASTDCPIAIFFPPVQSDMMVWSSKEPPPFKVAVSIEESSSKAMSEAQLESDLTSNLHAMSRDIKQASPFSFTSVPFEGTTPGAYCVLDVETREENLPVSSQKISGSEVIKCCSYDHPMRTDPDEARGASPTEEGKSQNINCASASISVYDEKESEKTFCELYMSPDQFAIVERSACDSVAPASSISGDKLPGGHHEGLALVATFSSHVPDTAGREMPYGGCNLIGSESGTELSIERTKGPDSNLGGLDKGDSNTCKLPPICPRVRPLCVPVNGDRQSLPKFKGSHHSHISERPDQIMAYSAKDEFSLPEFQDSNRSEKNSTMPDHADTATALHTLNQGGSDDARSLHFTSHERGLFDLGRSEKSQVQELLTTEVNLECDVNRTEGEHREAAHAADHRLSTMQSKFESPVFLGQGHQTLGSRSQIRSSCKSDESKTELLILNVGNGSGPAAYEWTVREDSETIRLRSHVNRKSQRQEGIADMLTDVIYKELLFVELCLQSAGDGMLFSQRPSTRVANQIVNNRSSETLPAKLSKNSKSKAKFCGVLKTFLPTGWRSVSAKHKSGSFLQVKGLRPHPFFSSATRSVALCPCNPPDEHALHVQEAEQSRAAAITPISLLDFCDVHSYVQKVFHLSNLIIDPSPCNWSDPFKVPISRQIFEADESQCLEEGVHGKSWLRKIDGTLLLDCINESLLKQLSKAILVPSSIGINSTWAQSVSDGHNLVQYITDDILEHQRFALKHKFAIEETIAKALYEEHWESCSGEADDALGDLAQYILSDLIGSLISEMGTPAAFTGESTVRPASVII